ncbi:MAG: type II toxin-antitoxin system HicA family toxin [Candidatus Gracilibacteria bacterium]|nr:type II toxin-antitoxin system HicA family toxin [Candidatus Gracilibacteria bacterium]
MGPLKPLTRKELIGKLKKLGFHGPFVGGKHDFMKNNSNFKITIPNLHSGKVLGKPIVCKICNEIGIDKNSFMDL